MLTTKLDILRVEDGYPLAVMRPADPARAVARVKEAAEKHDPALMRLAFEEQPHTFVGWLARDSAGLGKVVDHDGEVLGELQPGDSFVGDPRGPVPTP